MKKKIVFSVLAVVCVICCALGLMACGETSDVKFTFSLSSDGTYYSVTDITVPKDKRNEEIEVVIPSEYEGKPVKRIGEQVAGGFKISKLVIPNSINYIGNSAFKDSGGACEIGKVEFGDYSGATLATHDDKIQPYSIYLGTRAFGKLKQTSIEIPENAYLGNYLFDELPLTSVKFKGPIAVDVNGNYSLTAFSKTQLTAIELPQATAKYKVSIGSFTDTNVPANQSITSDFSLRLKYVVLPENITLSNWTSNQVTLSSGQTANVYPPKIYYKRSATDNNSIGGVSLTAPVNQSGKPSQMFEKFVYLYSETEPNFTGNYWHYVNGAPTEW